MVKKIKTVFNNSQLCHVWAQQTQSHGKGSNMYFRDDSIYSYGDHYLAAKIFQTKKGKVALVNSYTYSNSTAKHLGHIRRAIRGLATVFHVPRPYDIKNPENLLYLENSLTDAIDNALTKKIVKNLYQKDYYLSSIIEALREVNSYRSVLGIKLIAVPDELIEACRANLQSRFDHYLNNVAPEKLAKQKANEEKKKLELEENKKKFITYLEQWKKDGSWPTSQEFGFNVGRAREFLGHDTFRVQREGLVITSLGARVSENRARDFLAGILSGKVVPRAMIEDFTLERIDGDSIKIGCHYFSLDDAKKTFKEATYE